MKPQVDRRGCVAPPKTDTDGKAPITDVTNGVTVRGETKNRTQLIQYVW